MIDKICIKDKSLKRLYFIYQSFKGQLHCAIITFCKNIFWATVKTCYSGKEGETITIFILHLVGYWIDGTATEAETDCDNVCRCPECCTQSFHGRWRGRAISCWSPRWEVENYCNISVPVLPFSYRHKHTVSTCLYNCTVLCWHAMQELLYITAFPLFLMQCMLSLSVLWQSCISLHLLRMCILTSFKVHNSSLSVIIINPLQGTPHH